jgi:hypothetical protein
VFIRETIITPRRNFSPRRAYICANCFDAVRDLIPQEFVARNPATLLSRAALLAGAQPALPLGRSHVALNWDDGVISSGFIFRWALAWQCPIHSRHHV